MYKCPNRPKQDFENPDPDGYLDKFFRHEEYCTCLIRRLYSYKMEDQSNHIKDYWTSQGRLTVNWHVELGILLGYPKHGVRDILDIRYPYID